MESMTPRDSGFGNLESQARKLTSDSLSLDNMLAEEASRLDREDQASRLKALQSSIRQQMDEAKGLESAARYGHTKARLVTSTLGLAMGIAIRMASEDKRALAVSDHLLNNLGSKERPFGTVLVSIGPKGLPDDVGVVSISELARKSNQQESQVVKELRERGYVLFSKEAFSRLIDGLTTDVQEERLLLPVPTKKLADIRTSNWVKLEAKKPRWVPRSESPQNPQPSP